MGDEEVRGGETVGQPSAVAAATLAEEAVALAHAEPDEAEVLATRVMASGDADARSLSLAHEALGDVARERHDLDGAVEHLRRAVDVADRAGLAVRAGQARTALCHALLARGDPHAALAEADRAAEVLEGTDAARLLVRRALVLQRLGALDEALAAYRRALPLFRRAGDRLWEARLLTNRGVLATYRSEYGAAEQDLRRAEAIYDELGQSLASAQVRHNLGFVAGRRGDVPTALRYFDTAGEDYHRRGMTDWIGLADRCELLLSARLLTEAHDLARQAVAALAAAGLDVDLAEARLTLANVELLRGRPAEAAVSAEEARAMFLAQGRAPWAVLAGYLALRAEWQASGASRGLTERAVGLAAELEAAGWTVAAVDARLVAARSALTLGDVATAERELLGQRGARHRGPVEVRARAWHAEALLRLAHGDRRGADAALRAGMRVLDRHRATLGATELRAHVSGHGDELAGLGTRLAVEDARPVRVLRWAERWRAGALSLRPVRPPGDDALDAELTALRDTVARLDEAALAGADTRALERRQSALERAIQQRTRHAAGDVPADASALDLDELHARLGPERVLVEMVRVDDDLHAVVVGDGRVRLRRLGSHRAAVGELEHLRFGLRRLAVGATTPSARERAERSAGYAAARLDAELLAPLAADLGDRRLVVVPTGALHAVPWGMLPSCTGRPVTVAPSAQLWSRAAQRAETTGGRDVVLVGCPDPPHARGEVEALAERYASARVLLGEAATADAVVAALDGAGIAHLACHGRFRADNPLFSCLAMADGPLTAYDLERREEMPQLLVLSACDSGLSGVQPGDELMGMVAVLFSMGTATVVASVAPVPDEATRRLMLDLHDELGAGRRPAEALAVAAGRAADGDHRVAASAFVCFGAG